MVLEVVLVVLEVVLVVLEVTGPQVSLVKFQTRLSLRPDLYSTGTTYRETKEDPKITPEIDLNHLKPFFKHPQHPPRQYRVS